MPKYTVSISYQTEFQGDSEAHALVAAGYSLQYRPEPISNISFLAELKSEPNSEPVEIVKTDAPAAVPESLDWTPDDGIPF